MAHCPDPSNPTSCHVHPLQTFAGIRSPEFTAPQHDYPSYIEAVLRVADKRELSGTVTIKLNPRTVNLQLSSEPPGIPLLAGSSEANSPFSVPQIDGSEILISAPATADVGGRSYTFQSWSDGGARAHPIHVSSAQTAYTAVYTTPGEPPGGGGPKTDRSPPQTKLRKHPPKKTRSSTAKFAFGSSEAGSTFRCKLDRKKLRSCRSPAVYRRLKPGKHVFKVYAVDRAGNRDATPAVFGWKVLRKRR
jgi:hypothetical protein